MTPVDYAIIAVLAWSIIAAFLRGLIRSLFSLGGLLLGVVLAGTYYHDAALKLSRWISNKAAAETAAFLLIVFTCMLLATLLGFACRKGCEAVGLGLADRMGGACFGFLRGSLAITAIIMSLAAFLPQTALLKNSRLAPYFLTASHGVSFILPSDFQQRIANGVQHLKEGAVGFSQHR